MISNNGMTIWILALVLLASLAGLGYRQGAIRVVFSLIGIVLAALLAVPVGHILQPLLPHFGASTCSMIFRDVCFRWSKKDVIRHI